MNPHDGYLTDTTLPQNPLEGDIQNAIINELNARGYGVVRINGGKGRLVDPKTNQATDDYVSFYTIYPSKPRRSKGVSDLLVFKDGACWFLEVKRPGRYQDRDQKWFEQWCLFYDMIYRVVRSVDDALKAVSEGMTPKDAILREVQQHNNGGL